MTDTPQKSARQAELSGEVLEPAQAGRQAPRNSLDTVMCSREGDGLGGDRRVERRNEKPSDSPMDVLARLPAVVVLERVAVPALAMARDGTIVFANTAFAQMLGYEQDRLAGLASSEIFQTVPDAVGALPGADELANLVVQLRHCEGWTVRATMSTSALIRRDDPLVLVTFENLTEQLWVDER